MNELTYAYNRKQLTIKKNQIVRPSRANSNTSCINCRCDVARLKILPLTYLDKKLCQSFRKT